MTNSSVDEVEVYTDGACSGNPGPGGWGVVLQWRGQKKEIYGVSSEDMDILTFGSPILIRGLSGNKNIKEINLDV